jgi:macrolide transport system ATP-binding/permease protein
MTKSILKFHKITFVYESAPEPLFQNVSLHAPPGWSGVVGPNGTGKTTLLKLATGLLQPVEGRIDSQQDSLYCPQRTDNIPDRLGELICTNSKSAQVIKSTLSIQDDWLHRWDTLSHGERKRAQIAVALWLNPALLAVDEPTNHIDSEARDIVAKALDSFEGIGLLVSHDRNLLDSLCKQCFFIEPPDIIARPGGITKGMQVAKAEQKSAQRQHIVRKRYLKKLQRETARRTKLGEQSHKRLSKRHLGPKDRDGREKRDRARLTGKDSLAGKLQRQLSGRLKQVRKSFKAVTVKKQHTLGIWLPGSRSKRNLLFQLPADSLSLGDRKQLCYPELAIRPADRIALTGPNGSGKSTLIRHVVASLNVPNEHITYIPQEIDLGQSQNIWAQVQALPNTKLGYLMTIVSRLGSRPHRLLASTTPSPGETRKLLLAIGMTRAPHIVIMDEPTNHMDLPSIQCLEQALADCPCSLVLVSHDERFLAKLTQRQWDIVRGSDQPETFDLHITQ